VVAQTGRTGQRLYDAARDERQPERKTHHSLNWPVLLVGLNHVSRCIVNTNHGVM